MRRGGNYWTLFTPGIWKILHTVLQAKGFRRLMAHRQLPIRKAALAAHGARHTIKPVLERKTAAA